MKCKNEDCEVKVESAGTKPKLFCSDACRKKWTRTAAKRMEQADTLNAEQTDIIANGQVEPIANGQTFIDDNAKAIAEWEAQLLTLPNGVSIPGALPSYVVGDSEQVVEGEPAWKYTVDYADVVWRLLNWTIEEIENAGQYAPAWLCNREAA